jgi:MtN3 and saliva related transmembrane protein
VNIQLLGIVGVVTTVISILVKIIGLPDQIRKNHTRKSTTGLSVPFFVLGFVSYALWTLYGALKQDWVLILGQGAGMITMGIIAWQIYLYRNNKSDKT